VKNFESVKSVLLNFAFNYAWSGWRGSHLIWNFVKIFKPHKTTIDVAKLPNGFSVLSNDKDWITRTITEGTYERALLHFLNSLRVDSLVIDVGANIGVTLWHSLKNSSEGAKYLAFEPSAQCYSGLEFSSSQLNRTGSVLKFALGETNKWSRIYGIGNELHSGGASLKRHPGHNDKSENVRVRSLDSVLIETHENECISLLKIDTEGFEGQVLSGAQMTLISKKVEILILEVSPNFGDISYLINLAHVLDTSYLWFILDERGFIRRRPKLSPINLDFALSRMEQWNLVIMRKDILQKYSKTNTSHFWCFRNEISQFIE
jgi:FkbM family methyltransferase